MSRNAWILMRKKGRLIKELMQDYGISKATFYRYLKEAPIPVDAQSTSSA